MRKTPLYNDHLKLGAKMVPFAGWEMPVLYSNLIAEHKAVREAAGIFDVCHMGEIIVEGEEAEAALEEMTCNNLSKIYDGKALYSAITNEHGGIIDDIIIYRINKNKFLVCVNASNADIDFSWFQKHNKRKAKFTNLSDEYGLIAIQGPKAISIVSQIKGAEKVKELKRFHFGNFEINGSEVIIARTGYTGEDGCEIFHPAKDSSRIWNILLESGQGQGLLPCGLGARDTLRLEACYPLHGHELSPEISAVESGLSWIVKFDKSDYPGKEILKKQTESGPQRILTGFFLDDPGVARESSKVFSGDDKEIGFVTSGTKTPTINKSLGLCIIETPYSKIGAKIRVQVRDKFLNASIVELPFYKKAFN